MIEFLNDNSVLNLAAAARASVPFVQHLFRKRRIAPVGIAFGRCQRGTFD
jgi:hypothetical protein